jgi:hypothetical protein
VISHVKLEISLVEKSSDFVEHESSENKESVGLFQRLT